jgi:microcystin-dependent protein
MEAAVSGVTQITMTNSNYTLTNLNGVADEARSMVLVVGGTNSAIRQVIAPLVTKFYVVTNSTSGGYAITIGASTGSIITVPNGTTVQVYCDGTNFYSAQTSSAGYFLVNGTLTAAGATDTGNMTIGGTLGVTGTATFVVSPVAPTPSIGDNTTKLATTAFVQTAITGSIIPGQITMWPTASPPSGWLICDGSAVSRSTYSTLFGIVGTAFGSGDGSTTFNLPNYQGKVPMGSSSAYSLASTGGSADAVVVSHTHTATSVVTDPGHFHAANSQSVQPNITGGSGNINSASGNTSSATTGITVATTNSTTGVSGTGANLQPYLAINFIIKT